MSASFVINAYTISLTDSGTQTGDDAIVSTIASFDLSRLQAIDAILSISALSGDAADTFDVKLQMRLPDGSWDTRLRFPQVLGTSTVAGNSNATPSSDDPLVYVLRVCNDHELPLAAQAFQSSESSGVEISRGSVKNGPFPAKYATSAGQAATCRIVIDVTDADADFDVTGSIKLVCHAD